MSFAGIKDMPPKLRKNKQAKQNSK